MYKTSMFRPLSSQAATKRAAHSACTWLMDKISQGSISDPVPLPLFRSILNKQVEWGRSQRGVNIDFAELEAETRRLLSKEGVNVLFSFPDNKPKPEQEEHHSQFVFAPMPEQAPDEQPGRSKNEFTLRNEDISSAGELAKWLGEVLIWAKESGSNKVTFSATLEVEDA